jgi:hypothetical protein
VTAYFRHRTGALLVVNLAALDSAKQVAEFVGVPYGGRAMPHVKRTQ